MRRRVALISLAVFAFAFGTEVTLQIASLVAPRLLSISQAAGSSPDTITLLAVGDSHAYGAGVPKEDTYPAQLEKLLSSRFPERDFRVLNRGVPGVNSAFVANRLEKQILQHRPDMILVWVGTNNRWNSLETEVWGETGLSQTIHRQLLHLKLYRLARVAAFSWAGSDDSIAVEEGPGWRTGEGLILTERREKRLYQRESRPGLTFDMERMVRTSRALGTPILFVTYPLGAYGATNTILSAGAALDVPVVDSREIHDRARKNGDGAGDLMLMFSGWHPTSLLYGYIAKATLEPLTRALAEERGIVLSSSLLPNTKPGKED